MPCILFVSGQNLSSGQLKIFLTQVEKNKDWVAMDAASNTLTLASLEPLTHIVCGPASLADLATQLKRICFVKPSQKQDRRAWTDTAIAELVRGEPRREQAVVCISEEELRVRAGGTVPHPCRGAG